MLKLIVAVDFLALITNQKVKGKKLDNDEKGVLDMVMEQDCHGVTADNNRPCTVKVAYSGRTEIVPSLFRKCDDHSA